MHECIHMSKCIKLCTLNVCSLLSVNKAVKKKENHSAWSIKYCLEEFQGETVTGQSPSEAGPPVVGSAGEAKATTLFSQTIWFL